MALSCGSTVYPFDGSQFHDGPLYVDDPLDGPVTQFMNLQIPAGFGPINPPFLSAITQFTGSGYNSLAAVPTLPLPTPYAVDLLISNVPQRCFLVPGTISAGTAGVTIPNDYNPVTNPKYWVQLE